MDKKFKYHIFPEYNLIVEFWQGEFSFKEIIEFKNIEASDPDWKDYYNVLADDRLSIKKIDFPLNSDDKKDINDLSLSQKFIKKRKSALLTSKPSQVVISELLKQHKGPEALVQIEIFSTVEAALDWLQIDLREFNKINTVIEEFSAD